MGDVFIFPLSNSQTLQSIAIPYHIFEERYKSMIRDSVSSSQKILVTSPRSNNNYSGVIGHSGIPIILNEYDDGRMDIAITGVEKVRLTSQQGIKPYISYQYEILTENKKIENDADFQLLRELLVNEISSKEYFSENIEEILVLLNDPQLVISYAIMLLVKENNYKEKIIISNHFEEKIQMILDSLVTNIDLSIEIDDE